MQVLDLSIYPLDPPQFSIDELKDNIARFQALLALTDKLSTAIDQLFSWQGKRPNAYFEHNLCHRTVLNTR
jgi:hypothetical protein